MTLDLTSTAFAEFAATVAHTPEVLECIMMAGGLACLVNVRVKDMVAYRAFLGDTLVRLPGIR